MRVFKFLCLFAISLCLITGCEKQTFDSGYRPQIVPIEGDIEFRISDAINCSYRGIRFNWQTVDSFRCGFGDIDVTASKTGNDVSLCINGIKTPGFCRNYPIIPTAKTDFPTANGVYRLNFSMGNEQATGELQVTTDRFSITMRGDSRFKSKTVSMMRKPYHAIYGTIQGSYDPSNDSVVRLFMDSLYLLGARPGNFAQGDYGDLTVDSSGRVVANGRPIHGFLRKYMIEYTGSLTPMKEFIHRFGARHDLFLQFDMSNRNGDYFWGGRPIDLY